MLNRNDQRRSVGRIVERLDRMERTLGDPLGKLHAAVADASRLVRTLTLIFLLVGLYIAILGGTTDHEMLFRAGKVQAPLLNIGIPVVGFYVLAPFLFLILHANLLLQVFFLAGKAKRLKDAIDQLPEAERDAPRWLIFPTLIGEMMFEGLYSPAFRRLLRTVNWLILCGLPPLLLLWLQIRFLPYQHAGITWWHRLCLAADLGVVWFLWPLINHQAGIWWPRIRELWRVPPDLRDGWLTGRLSLVAGLLVTPLVLAFSVLIAVIPGGAVERWTGELALTQRVFDDPSTRWLFFARHLELRDRTLVAAEPPPELIADLGETDAAFLAHAKGLNLVNRSFRGADLSGANLTRAILIGADLSNADLSRANLQGATLCNPPSRIEARCAQLNGADVHSIILRNASLFGIDLAAAQQIISIVNVRPALFAQGTSLLNVNLQGAYVSHANLQGALLHQANLQGANMHGANLQGAHMWEASLQGANLQGANLRGAGLQDANLQVARLFFANLQGARLKDADLRGTVLEIADLQGASLVGSDLRGADLMGANIKGADLRSTRLWATRFDRDPDRWTFADLRGASLRAPTRDDIEEGKRRARDIQDERARERVLSALEDFESRLDAPRWPWPRPAWLTEQPKVLFDPWHFDPPERDFEREAWVSSTDREGWLQPMPFHAFEHGLAAFLADLACADDSPPAVALGIARRVLGMEERRRPYAVGVAERMIGGPCPGAAELDEDVRVELTALAERAPADQPRPTSHRTAP